MPMESDMRNEFNLVGITNSVRSNSSFNAEARGFDSVRSYQHMFEAGLEDDDDSVDDEQTTALTGGSNSPNGNNGYHKGRGGKRNPALAFFYRHWKSILVIVTLLCIVLLTGWTFFTAEYEVIKKPKKHSQKSPHQYTYQKEEIHSCEKDGCGLSAQADDRHKNITHVFKNNTEIEKDHCGWGDKTKYMPGDSAIHFEARKNVGKGCTYCKNKDKCVYKHPLFAVCLSDSQCMSNKCDKEQLCAK